MLNSSTRDIINTTKSLNVNKASYRARRCIYIFSDKEIFDLFFECEDGCCRTK